jgi:signal transduction histidine kinase
MIKPLQPLWKSFTAKLIILLIITIICLSALFDWQLINMQKKNYRAFHGTHGLSLVRMLAHSLTLAVFFENKEELAVPIQGVMLQDDVVEVVVWDKNGQVLFHKTKDPKGRLYIMANSLETEAVMTELDKHQHLTQETEESFLYWCQIALVTPSNIQESWYFVDKNQKDTTEVIGYVAVAMSKKFFAQEVHTILLQTGVSGLIFLIVVTLATFFIISHTTEPLRNLMLLIRKSTGVTTATDDLTMITESYGSMIEDLEKSFITITELNEELEKKVEQRTLLLTEANEELSMGQQKLLKSNVDLTMALDQLQDTQDQLLQKEKLAAIGQIVAGVAHEINNSTNFISAALPSLYRYLANVKEVLACYEELEKVRGTKELNNKFDAVQEIKDELGFHELFGFIDQLMENINEGARRTTRIVQDLKTFSRHDAETFTFSDLHAVIDSTINYLDQNLMEHIKIVRDYGSIPPVFCLPGRISQVFLNIMHNAIQAMNGEGQLRIKTHYENKHVHIIFSDTGCGIAHHAMTKIFDPFFTTKEVGKGTGLGLGISHSIIRQHGGTIKAHSNEGEGAVFEVILPVESKDITGD